jgi:alanyl-tRNA synthetase
VTSIIQGTKGLKDFANAKISNYETDIFRPIFDKLEELSGKKYGSTLPPAMGSTGDSPVPPGDPPGGTGGDALSSSSVGLQKGASPHSAGQVARATQGGAEASLKTSGEGPSNIIEVPAEKPHPGRASDEDAELAGNGNSDRQPDALQIQIDIAFRVIADHIRTLSFAIADGIQPGNNDRNYVLRRILRRAVRYGRSLGFQEPFFYKLVDVLADTMGDVFPEIRAKKKHVQEVICSEEEAFNKTLDSGCEIFESALTELSVIKNFLHACPSLFETARGQMKDLDSWEPPRGREEGVWASIILGPIRSPEFAQEAFESLTDSPAASLGKVIVTKRIIIEWQKWWRTLWDPIYDYLLTIEKLIKDPSAFAQCREKILNGILQLEAELPTIEKKLDFFPGRIAFKLYDTYGFPLDLTELMARERGLTVDKEGFDKLMEEQKARARAAQKKEVISLSQIETTVPTKFVGYDRLTAEAKVLEVVLLKDKTAVILDTSACYAEMGGQVGDTGELSGSGQLWRVTNTQKSGNTWLHFISDAETGDERVNRKSQIVNTLDAPTAGSSVTLSVDKSRRNAIERHHTVTHLLHWALHEVASRDASQKGSFVGPDKLTFDFNSAPLTPQQVADIEKLVNERIVENAPVSWTEVPHAEVKNRKDVMQFFGDKYGDVVRVVQIGGHTQKLDGYSMELCGGTHTRATGEIGLFRIVGESAIAAGVRRIEAVAGLEAYGVANSQLHLIRSIAGKINSPVHELEKKVDLLLAHQKELEKSLKAANQRNAAQTASWLLTRSHEVNGVPLITQIFPDAEADYLQVIVDALKGRFKGVVVVGGAANGAVALVASVSAEFTGRVQAGKIIQQIAPVVGGKGGGKPDNARGGGKDASKLEEALAKVKSLI